MIEQFLSFILQCLEFLKFWIVLEPFEQGVLVRLGKFVKVLDPGLHWKYPLSIDIVHYEHVVPSTHSLGYESITTRDGKHVAYHAICTYQVRDIKKAMLEVEDVNHAVRDACSGEIGRVLHGSSWTEIVEDEILEKISSACRKRGFRYGIEIMSVQLASLSLVKNIRLMQ